MKNLKLLQEELAIMRVWQGECKRLELHTMTTQIVIIEHALQSAEAKITEEYAEEITWAKKAAQANYKDAEANIAETVYSARIGWFRREVAKMESELKKLRRKAKRTLREINELDAYAARFKVNAGTNANANTNANEKTDGTFCFECGQWIEDTEDMDACICVQPSHERGTVTKKIHVSSDRYYSEFVCPDCIEKHYRQCGACGEFYHKSRCTQDEQGNWICENCREQHAD